MSNILGLQYNDLIGEAYFDLGPMIKRCMKDPTRGHHVVFNNPEVVAERKKRLRIKVTHHPCCPIPLSCVFDIIIELVAGG
jgi:hypothetical protein